jgi:pimeloyl-ACP methyl ester carboxylesterase
MRLPLKSLLIGGTIGAATTAVANVSRRYQHWKQQQKQRLETGSQLIGTARGQVEYRLEGDGPAVLLIHGSPGGYDQAVALAHFLALHGYTTLAVSRPGYLRTPLVSGKTPEEQADLYALVLDMLNIPQVVIIANSGGGPSALQFALRHPEHCRGLIMIAGLSQKYSEEETYRALPWARRQTKQVVDKLVLFDPALYLLLTLSQRVPEGANVQELLASLSLNDLRTFGYENDMEQFADLPVYPVRDIIAPTLLVHGTDDIDVPFAQSEQLARRMPHAQLVPVEFADHVSVLTNTATASTIQRFLHKVYGI